MSSTINFKFHSIGKLFVKVSHYVNTDDTKQLMTVLNMSVC